MTDSDLEIDFFNFDWWLHVHNEFKPAREFCTIKVKINAIKLSFS